MRRRPSGVRHRVGCLGGVMRRRISSVRMVFRNESSTDWTPDERRQPGPITPRITAPGTDRVDILSAANTVWYLTISMQPLTTRSAHGLSGATSPPARRWRTHCGSRPGRYAVVCPAPIDSRRAYQTARRVAHTPGGACDARRSRRCVVHHRDIATATRLAPTGALDGRIVNIAGEAPTSLYELVKLAGGIMEPSAQALENLWHLQMDGSLARSLGLRPAVRTVYQAVDQDTL